MPPSSVPTPPAYMTVKQQLNACTATQISGFITACLSGSGGTACTMFQQDSANAACLGCLAASGNTGGLLADSSGQFFALNQPGCIALKDTTNGSACAQALAPALFCENEACGTCADQTSYDACAQAADGSGGVCNSDAKMVQSSCAKDFGDAGAGASCGSAGGVFNVICGTGQ
jgi:hypothetical protein